jgi:hypothetical protein
MNFRRLLPGLALFTLLSNTVEAQVILDDSFEDRSVNGWASYPPAQDTAYDPELFCSRVDRVGPLALCRALQPNSVLPPTS